jgi:hypothetical protein
MFPGHSKNRVGKPCLDSARDAYLRMAQERRPRRELFYMFFHSEENGRPIVEGRFLTGVRLSRALLSHAVETNNSGSFHCIAGLLLGSWYFRSRRVDSFRRTLVMPTRLGLSPLSQRFRPQWCCLGRDGNDIPCLGYKTRTSRI